MGGGFFSGAGLFGTGGSPAQIVTTSPYDQMVQGGQSGNFNDLANTNSTYLADMFSQLGTGQAPSYYQKYQNQAMPYQQGMLNQQFFGTPGNRSNQLGVNGQPMGPSAMGNAMTMASMFGMNPKATTGMANKVQQQYQNASQMLDNYFAGQGLNVIQNTAQNLPGWATGQQNSLTEAFRPTTNVIPAQGGTTGFLGDWLTSMLSGQGMPSMGGGGAGGGGASGLTSNTAYQAPGMSAWNAGNASSFALAGG